MTEAELNQAIKDGDVEQLPKPAEPPLQEKPADDFSAELNQTRLHSTALFMPSALRVYRGSSTQTIPNSTPTKIEYNAKSFDQLGEFDELTNSRFEPRYPGKYLITAVIEINSLDINKQMLVYIYKNGSEYSRSRTTSPQGNDTGVTMTDLLDLLPGDYIEMYVNHNTGSDEFLGQGESVNWLGIHRLS